MSMLTLVVVTTWGYLDLSAISLVQITFGLVRSSTEGLDGQVIALNNAISPWFSQNGWPGAINVSF